ncbi:DUF3617 domain-containing protein [Ottowia thiooxydans]|uniref:DUF3617 domain-containing protein n=1 Tax=Ottowia thiooxydans TaxID=219182 RepID=UPI0003F53529|nr:DUF3617 domain-containing protein [Ottowia thiooxydans]
MGIARIVVLPALSMLIAASGAAHAQSVKPGLWDTRVLKMTVDGKDMLSQMNAAQEQMRQAMAKMPADQRKKMESMLGGQGGDAMSSRICISPEMAAKDNAMFQQPPNSDCDAPKFNKSGNRMNFEMSCKHEGGRTVAKGETVFGGDEMSSKVEAVMTGAGGAKRTSVTETQMKFVSANCGTVKPVDQLVKDLQSQTGRATGPAPAKK